MQAYEDQVSLVRVAQNQVEACEDELASRGAEIEALQVGMPNFCPLTGRCQLGLIEGRCGPWRISNAPQSKMAAKVIYLRFTNPGCDPCRCASLRLKMQGKWHSHRQQQPERKADKPSQRSKARC